MLLNIFVETVRNVQNNYLLFFLLQWFYASFNVMTVWWANFHDLAYTNPQAGLSINL